MTRRNLELAHLGLLIAAVFASSCAILSAQTVSVQGLIKGRSGPMIVLQTADSPKAIVILTDKTQVSQVQGVFKARKKTISMAALVPGLAVQVEGDYNESKQLVAKSIKFKGDDLKRAQSVQAGLSETKARAAANSEEIEKQKAALDAQAQNLQVQKEALQQQQQQLAADQEKIAANKAAIEAAMARFGQLDDYYILDEVTVHFGNGKVALEPKYKPELLQLAAKAKKVNAYMVQIKGYASAAGSEALNQKLSQQRAENVASFLLQQGHVPMTNMLAPGAMGESEQVGNAKTADGQAENRRVVVRVLQNKGIAGI